MTVITVFALFGDDIRILCAPKHADPYFYVVSATMMFLFAVEIILASFAKPDYLNSFFFWLDILSTISLITDIEPLMTYI